MIPQVSPYKFNIECFSNDNYKPLARAVTFSELPEFFEKQVTEQNPLFEKYHNFVKNVDGRLSVEELAHYLQFIDEHLGAWKSKKEAVYLKSKESHLPRTIEYDPKTEQVYMH